MSVENMERKLRQLQFEHLSYSRQGETDKAKAAKAEFIELRELIARSKILEKAIEEQRKSWKGKV